MVADSLMSGPLVNSMALRRRMGSQRETISPNNSQINASKRKSARENISPSERGFYQQPVHSLIVIEIEVDNPSTSYP